MANAADQLFWMLAGTVAVVRVWLFVVPVSGPTFFGLRVHHYMFGAVGIPIAVAFHWPQLYAVSLGLLFDELTFVAIGGRTHDDNFSAVSVLGTISFVAFAFFVREILFRPMT